MDDFYKRLATAIVMQAVIDYRKVTKNITDKPFNELTNHEIKNISDKEDLERFFKSQYFMTLTKLNGQALLNKLELEVKAKCQKQTGER